MAHFFEEFVGEEADIGFLDACEFKYVSDIFGNDRVVEDLLEGGVFGGFGVFAIGGCVFDQNSPNGTEEGEFLT